MRRDPWSDRSAWYPSGHWRWYHGTLGRLSVVQEGGEKPKALTPGTEASGLWGIQALGLPRFYSWEQWKAERLRWRRLDFCAALGVELITSCATSSPKLSTSVAAPKENSRVTTAATARSRPMHRALFLLLPPWAPTRRPLTP